MTEHARKIASHFAVEDVTDVQDFALKGNINREAFTLHTTDRKYLLQRLNTDVFTRPDRVTKAMRLWTEAQAMALVDAPWADPYESVAVVPTREGHSALVQEGAVWRVLSYIEGTVCHRSLSEAGSRSRQLKLAEETGRGLAVSIKLSGSIDASELETSLLGYRDTRGYVAQYDSIIAGAAEHSQALQFMPEDPELAEATKTQYLLAHRHQDFVERFNQPEVQRLMGVVQKHRDSSLELQRAVLDGRVRRTVIHGDTKLENFLFCRETGRVRSLVDLDTVMAYTWLADWGDLARSLVNVAGEDEPDLERVSVDADVYQALERGFLSVVGAVPSDEIAWMPRAVMTITFELGLRFLTDYLRGDNYFRVTHPKSNLTRARVQFALLERLAEHHGVA